MEGFFADCWFVMGCEGTKEEDVQPEIRELRKVVRNMLLLQYSSFKRSTPAKFEDATLPLYAESHGLLTPTGQNLTAQSDGEDF
jgi:hypothetical protein